MASTITSPGTTFWNTPPLRTSANLLHRELRKVLTLPCTLEGLGRRREMGGTMNRIEILKGFLEQDPKDSFSRYALALEYVKRGQTEDARREFEYVRDHDPGYVATYFQLAQLYRNSRIAA